METESEESKNAKARKASIKEGSVSSIMTGAGDSYIVPYALALKASNFQIGFLSSFVGLFSAMSQLIGGELVYRVKRKKLVLIGVFLQSLAWLAISILGFLYWKGIFQSKAILLLIIFYCCASISGSLAGPAWFSWMGEMVPTKVRGEYFSRRNKIIGIVAIIVTLISSIFLQYMKDIGLVILAFSILSFVAFLGRFAAWLFFTKMYEENKPIKKESYFSILQFVKKAPSNNYGRFAIYIGLMNFATYLAAPFYAVYLLNELGYNYIWFTIVILSAALFTAIFMPLWGKVGDLYGNKNLLAIGALVITINPLIWLFTTNPVIIILTAQLTSGIGWSAFNLAASNFIYDAVTPERRALCVAYYTVFNGLGIFFGAIIGGYIIENVTNPYMSIFFFIFILSALGRGIFSLIFIPKIKEVRELPPNKERLSLVQYAYLITPRPIFSVVKKFKSVNLFKDDEDKEIKENKNEIDEKKS